MTSLVLTSYRPFKPVGGAPLRNWQNISALMAYGPVDVVTVGVEDAREPMPGIREWAPFSATNRSRWDRFKTACAPLRPGVYPGIDTFHQGRVTRWIRDRASTHGYDLAVIETISLAAYLDDLKGAATRVVFDAHNVESSLHGALVAGDAKASSSLRRIKNEVLRKRMLAAERAVVNGADLVWACSEVDAREIGRIYGRRTGVTVVPNGVDVDDYQRRETLPADGDWGGGPITMVYPALFSYAPNEDAALRLIQDVLPAVRARGHQAHVVLVGRNPTPRMVQASRGIEGVELTGSVESVVPYLQQPCVITLPIAIGAGTRLKILEAFAIGRPVVSTAKGAEGIDVVDGEHLLIRESVDAIAAAVIDLWRDPTLRRGLCENALDLVRSRYSWAVAAQRIAESLAGGSLRIPEPAEDWRASLRVSADPAQLPVAAVNRRGKQ